MKNSQSMNSGSYNPSMAPHGQGPRQMQQQGFNPGQQLFSAGSGMHGNAAFPMSKMSMLGHLGQGILGGQSNQMHPMGGNGQMGGGTRDQYGQPLPGYAGYGNPLSQQTQMLRENHRQNRANNNYYNQQVSQMPNAMNPFNVFGMMGGVGGFGGFNRY